MIAAIYSRKSPDNKNKNKRGGEPGAKSVNQQRDEGRAFAAAEKLYVQPGYEFVDDSKSASRFGVGARKDWLRLRQMIQAGGLDGGMLILWESSRGSRDLPDWAAFLADCREHKVLIHVITDRHTYDMSVARDWRNLAEDGIDSAMESEKTSMRVRRDMEASARAGNHHSRPPLGFRLHHDPATGAKSWLHSDRAPEVAAAITAVADGHPISAAARRLGVTTSHMRKIIRNPVYAGLRPHGGETYQGKWEPIVTEEVWRAAVAVLDGRRRAGARPGHAVHLLSFCARCVVCKAYLTPEKRSERSLGGSLIEVVYLLRCQQGHVAMREHLMDTVVESALWHRMSQPDFIARYLSATNPDSSAARIKAAQLRERHEQLAAQAASGEISGTLLGAAERKLLAEIRAADAEVERLAVPAVLRGYHPQARAADWWGKQPLARKKDVLRELTDAIYLHPGRGPGRVEIVWKDTDTTV